MAQNQKSYDTEFKAQAVKLAQEIGGHKAARVFFARPFCIKLQKLFVGRCSCIL